MGNQAVTLDRRRSAFAGRTASEDYLLRQGILKLLAIKDSDIRILTLEQCRDAVDKGLHAGGAFSATIPLVALFYGGFIDLDIADPTRRGPDMFTLSKGHAVAALASIYAELGYFERDVLRNSRSYDSILNGHPGPVLPGVQIATGPMGQGFGVAQGFAIAGRTSPRFDSYCMAGDGELQEGPIWEAVMYAGAKKLDNLCLLVDRNYGQLDLHTRMIFPMPELEPVFTSFGWQAHSVDATQYDGVYSALEQFRYGPRNGKPTVIVCHATKGHGALSDFLNKHKVTVADKLTEQELALQADQRRNRVEEYNRFHATLEERENGERSRRRAYRPLPATCIWTAQLRQVVGPCRPATRAPARQEDQTRRRASAASRQEKGIRRQRYRHRRDESLRAGSERSCQSIPIWLRPADSKQGVGTVDQRRALNAGVAEANMMLIGEAFAALGLQYVDQHVLPLL
jgi:transketolase N-terminal domain/subunit